MERRKHARISCGLVAVDSLPELQPIRSGWTKDAALAQALREWNLAQPAWCRFKKFEEAPLVGALWIVERSYQLRGI